VSTFSREPTTLVVKCPGCGSPVPWTEQAVFRPFCSERCKNTDFIGWANEQHQLPGDVSIDDLMSEDLEKSLDR
jgi:endogenous inhibitor of DNA gyrase (YacG/DUF329 family)